MAGETFKKNIQPKLWFGIAAVSCDDEAAAITRVGRERDSGGRKELEAKARPAKPESFKLRRENPDYAFARLGRENLRNSAWDQPG